MPQTPLPNIGVNYEYTLGTNDWKNGVDSAFVILDMNAQAFVIDQRTAEPGAPAVGDSYLLGPGAPTGTNWGSDSGAVAGAVAVFTAVPGQPDASDWFYIAPREGFRFYDRTINRIREYVGAWSIINGVEKITAASFEPTLDNRNGTVLIDNGAHTLNIPDEATIPFVIGDDLHFINQNAAAITVTDDAAVGYATGSQNLVVAGIAANAHAKIRKTGVDEWFVLFNETLPT
jgi:hypothetical protein